MDAKSKSPENNPDPCLKLRLRLQDKEKELRNYKAACEDKVEASAMAETIINKQLRNEIEIRKQLQEDLLSRERSLAEAQKIAHLGSWEYIVSTHETFWSQEEFRIFGITPSVKSPPYEEHLLFIHPQDVELVDKSLTKALQDFREFSIENRIIRPDGQVRYVRNIGRPIANKDGKVVKVIGTTLDITDIHERTEELNRTRLRLESIVDGIDEQIILISNDFKVLWANKTFRQQYDCSPEELSGKTCYALTHGRVSPCQPPDDICPLVETLKTGKTATALHVHHGAKGDFFSQVSAYPIKNEKGEVVEFVHMSRDVTAQKEEEEKLLTLSFTDPLTGLFNRRGFINLSRQQLKVAKRNKQDMELIFSDLDNMKWINDHFGHREGDSALMEVASLLLQSFRESDIVARIGGDEFAVLAIQTGKESGDSLTARLHKRLNEHNTTSGRQYPLSLSVGVAYCEGGSNCGIDELLSQADKSMYEDKRSKKDAPPKGTAP
ncbi:MAG TPA: diguanylate cyclase [Candidatus Margulisiibacteriota bacterium]|nr:diguanylate cyclase [Candidatus Margulisiibacteriota bacterium]